MKKLACLSVLLLVLFSPRAFAQYEGTMGFGAHAGYGNEIKSMGVGAHLHYYYTNQLRFAPSFTYYLPRKGNKMWEIDADAHYMVPVSWLFSFYPVAGLNYSNRHVTSKASDVGLQDRTTHRIGANLGAGIQYDFGYKTRISFEYKHQFIKDFSQSSFMVGIGFWI